MNGTLRMIFGRSGSRLERILVSGRHQESVEDPLWLKILLLLIWIGIPILVSRYAIPTSTTLQETVIDASRLKVSPPPAPEIPPLPEPRRSLPPERPPAPLAKPEPPPPRVAEKLPEQHPVIAPPRIEPSPPTITRPSRSAAPEVQEYRPRLTRERVRAAVESGAPTATRVRREAVPSEAPSTSVNITHSRGGTALDIPAGNEQRVAALRRSTAAEGPAQEGGTAPRPAIRSGRPSERPEISAPRAVASRERTQASGTGEEREMSAAGVTRGVSLATLEICSSPSKEEEDIRAVLGIVSSRQSCADEKGVFQFKGTKRISSFNLIIFPAKGRKPSNRCEELENAYKCLKTH